MIKVIGIIILTAFYGVYFGKMAAQHKKAIRTDQMAKGKAKSRLFYTELTLKLATYLVVLAEISSLIPVSPLLLSPLVLAGIVFAVSGVIIFAASVAAMKDNWRAGIAENDRIGIVPKVFTNSAEIPLS